MLPVFASHTPGNRRGRGGRRQKTNSTWSLSGAMSPAAGPGSDGVANEEVRGEEEGANLPRHMMGQLPDFKAEGGGNCAGEEVDT